MHLRRLSGAAAVLGGAAAAVVFQLVATSATAQADTAPPAPFFGEFPDFTGTPTTVFDIPDFMRDVQGDMGFFPFGASNVATPGTANEFTSLLGIQNVDWSQTGEPAGSFVNSDELQLTLPGTMGSSPDALFENDLTVGNGIFLDIIGSPAAGYAMEFNAGAGGVELLFYSPFGDFGLPIPFGPSLAATDAAADTPNWFSGLFDGL